MTCLSNQSQVKSKYWKTKQNKNNIKKKTNTMFPNVNHIYNIECLNLVNVYTE